MILIEHGPEGREALFEGALGTVAAWTAGEVAQALADLDAARARGHWVAGWIAYEAGYALEQCLGGLMPERSGPLLCFGVYAGPLDAAGVLARARVEAGAILDPVVPMVSQAQYASAFGRVKDYIAAGDCYQINLTFPMRSRLRAGTALGLYGALRARQSVGYGAFADMGAEVGDDGHRIPLLISRSPELFVRTDAAGRIESRPMKGTAPRDVDPVRDSELAEELRTSDKGRAENLMIVDLLRNDISRIAQVGSVKVPLLFAVESYATLHQMISRVVGNLTERPSIERLMTALFPCGSITGAPKIRAMEIIREVEPFARGAYCGAIGWMDPEGVSCFSVAIRTLSLAADRGIVLNVGSGVVQDSTCDGEWEEAHWKARYVTGLASRG